MLNVRLRYAFIAAMTAAYVLACITACQNAPPPSLPPPTAPPTPDPQIGLLKTQLSTEQQSRTELQEQTSTQRLIIGLLAGGVIIAIYIGAGWGSSTRKGGEQRRK